MRTLFRVGIGVTVGGLIFAGIVALWAYRASQHVPEFYQKALKADPNLAAQASDRMVQQALDLTCDVRQSGEWEALFTAQQINGWLAVDLVKNHPNLLPGTVSNPRVSITKQAIHLGCQYKTEHLSTVCSMCIEPSLAEPTVLALRVRGAKAGDLPLPLNEILDGISSAAEGSNMQLRWRKEGDDPVALITLPSPSSEHGLRIRLTRLELREGAIYLAGQTVLHGEEIPEVSQSVPSNSVQR